MADFSEYTTPIEEWLVLEKSLPKFPEDITAEQLKAAANRDREALAAKAMVEEGRFVVSFLFVLSMW